MSLRVGADIGGTFTDLVLVGEDGATFEIGKVLTSPRRPDDAVIEGLSKLVDGDDERRAAITNVVHGTTLFTNALIERKGAVTALITTKGFRDAVEIGREHRYDIYDLRMKRPEPLAPRRLRFELDERVLADGSVRKALDEGEVRALAQTLIEAGVEAVGVSLIHAYANDAHERRVAKILAEEAPDVALTLSSELVPEIGEYVRGSTVLANVYVKGIAEQYLSRLRERLKGELDLPASLFIMQSDGGLCEIEAAAQAPVRLVESGPAGGALAAAYYGDLLGHVDVLAFDMGGTTAKACVIADGNPLVANEFEVDRQYQFKKQSGLPVKVPVIEMIEIGTGGGSIARVDALKRLQVGPDSAGSDPGPASYALGGDQPTVTDADLLLGYLDPGFFLGGTMALDVKAAEDAIRTKVAEPLGLSVLEAAWGIHQLANESMASAARIHTIERGKNITAFPIFATGGAGPVHAFGVASILRSPRVIYPLGAGVMSSIGFLTAPMSIGFSRSLPGRLDKLDWDGVARIVGEMEASGREILGRTIDDADIGFNHFADMRYQKQGFEVRVPIAGGTFDAARHDDMLARFEETYRGIYGHVMEGTPVEAISWRVVAHGPKPTLALPKAARGESKDPATALKGRREIYLPAQKALAEVPIYDRYRLPASAVLNGPAIVEERESTVVVNGAGRIQVDENSNLIIDLLTGDEG
ncbi:MAG: hydantoinase/oxoprolinase family protein [Pseudomonadota bacterium]